MRDENKNVDRMRDDRDSNGGMRDKDKSAGAKFVHFEKPDTE